MLVKVAAAAMGISIQQAIAMTSRGDRSRRSRRTQTIDSGRQRTSCGNLPISPTMNSPMSSFSDPEAVARYAEGPVRQVPGFHALQRMAALLLAESVPADGNVLVVGAGGGLELKVFADAQPGWHFVGVDPSAEMLKLAVATLGPLAARVDWVEGYVDAAAAGPFDGAACLLTLHFLAADERLHTLKELRRRLKPGAPLVVAHHSFPQGEREKARWLERYAAFAVSSGIPAPNMRNAIDAIGARLPLLSPQQDVALVQEAGFDTVELFYAGFTFKGWVAYAPS
jgi:tRNA (cmo5U34)-methyltransferase